MSLLAPLFLLGALAIAGPIVAHLVRRNTRDRIAFSATQFLDPSAPRLDRRNRVEHPWLLLLRILIILTLAAGFARPFLREAPPELGRHAAVRHHVVVLDESASMQRQGLWSEAVARARATAARLGPGDGFALVAAGRGATALLTADAWSRTAPGDRLALLDSVLESRSPGWEATHLDTGIERALEELSSLRERAGVPTEAAVVVISDLAEGTRLSGLAGQEWPDGLRVDLVALEQPSGTNAALHWLGWSTDPDGTHQARVRVMHDAFDSREYRLALSSADAGPAVDTEPVRLTLAPRESRALSLPVPAGHAGPLRVDLSGDTEAFDNTLWIIPPERRTFPLAYWGGGDADDAQSSLYYVSRAIRGWREPEMDLTSIPVDAAPPLVAPLHLVTEPLSPAAAGALRRQLDAGSFVLVLARSPELVATAAALAEESGWTTGADAVAPNALLADLAFTDPLFAAFADPRYSDFTRIRFWKAPAIGLPETTRATVVARFDDRSPAVIDLPVGSGRLVVWAGDWTPASSQWVLSTKFVPWFQSLALRAVGGPAAPSVAEVGEIARLGLPAGAQVAPRPGVHEVRDGDRSRWVALNVPAVESRVAPLPLDTWEALGVPIGGPGRGDRAAPAESIRTGSQLAAQVEAEQQLWRWLLLAAAGVLALESILATAAARRAPSGRPAPA